MLWVVAQDPIKAEKATESRSIILRAIAVSQAAAPPTITVAVATIPAGSRHPGS